MYPTSRIRRPRIRLSIKLEIVTSSEPTEEFIKSPADAARSGKMGDRKIFVLDVGEVIRIRNDDRGESAL
jgi:nitrogen regulatory protein P-II 1